MTPPMCLQIPFAKGTIIAAVTLYAFICRPTLAGPPVKLNGPLVAGGNVSREVSRFSPDGSRVFYAADQDIDGIAELFSVPSGGGTPVKLNIPFASGVSQQFFVSPDSEHVYYQDIAPFAPTAIFAVPSVGGASVNLSHPLTSNERLFNVGLSADGSHLIYTVRYASDPVRGLPQLYGVPTTGGAPTLIASRDWVSTGQHIVGTSISPDGSRVLYNEGLYGRGLFSAPILGGTSVQLNAPLGPDEFIVSEGYSPIVTRPPPSLRFSPDGSRVVYQIASNTSESRGSYIVPIAGGTPVKLNGPLVPGGNVAGVQFSSDGVRVVYGADQDTLGRYELYSVPSTGGIPVKLNGPLVSGSVTGPTVVSPDGSRVVYSAAQDTVGVSELYIVPIVGGMPLKLNGPMGAGGGTWWPQFTPDGSRVIYGAKHNASDPGELFSVSSSGGVPVKLNSPLLSGGNVGWQPDYGRGGVSPDGSRVAHRADQETDEFYEWYIVPTTGGTPMKFSAGLKISYGNFSPDGSRFLFENSGEPGVPTEIYSRVLRQHWNGGSGNWDTAASWNYGELPDGVMQITIAGSASVVATGNATARAVNELRLGGGTGISTLTLQSGAAITAVNGVAIESNSVLYGNGSIAGNVTNSGVVSPGTAVGALQIGGYSQSAAGALQIDLGGSLSYDKLQITGAASLDGTLAVSLINSFTPSAGQTFDILEFATLSGSFDTLQLPALVGQLNWDTSQLYSNGSLSIIGSLEGDYNSNGRVDAADYVVWRKSGGTSEAYDTWRSRFGETAASTILAGDYNADRTVNAADYIVWRKGFETGAYTKNDYNMWRANFGASAAGAAAAPFFTSIPEPSGLSLATVVLAALMLASERRRPAGRAH